MAGKSCAGFAFLYLTCFLAQAMQTNSLVNYNDYVVHGVPGTLWVKALRALEKHSPTHHRYSNSQMISVQELEEPPYKLYKFTFYMNPICGAESCPREACTIDLKQKGDIEDDDIEALNDSIQCMYFYTAEAQNDTSQEQQSYQDQEDFQITQESVTEQANNNRSVELAHEIQESGDEEIRPFIAMRASSNYCPGCPYELNPNLPSLLVYAEQALRSIDENTTNDYKHKLMSIIKVTRSVPVSSNVVQYQLLLLIGESGCLKNALEQEQECPLRSTDSIRQCLVTFEQRPWQPTSLKVIKNNCTDSENSHVNTSNQSQQPDLESQPLVTVKYNEGQSSRTEVADAYEGLRDMLDNYTHISLTPSKQSEETVVTESMNVKVVLNRSQDDEKIVGFTDKAKEFGEFLEHFDLPVKAEDPVPDTREPVKEEKFQRKKVSVENLNIEKANEERDVINRRKRSMTKRQLVGAPTAISVNDPQIQHYANKALRKVSDESDDLNEPLIVEITEATSQVVAGTLYKIKAKLGTSNCPKGTKDNCQLQAGSEVKECLIKVWSRPWLDQGLPEITVTCSPPSTNRRKRSLRGVNYNQKMLQIAEDMRTDQEFNKFVETYNRTYSTPEERNLRLAIFRENLGIIKLLRRTEQGTGRYGVNMFADMSREEFRSRYLGLRPDLRLENDIPLRKAEIPDVELPLTFDWRKKGAVTPVKNQGSCGSCWAFSVTGNVEGQYAIKHGQLLSLSEQELVDCDNLDDGCSGGLPDNAYRAIEQLGGLELESDYPYEAENEKCHFKKNLAKVQLASAVNITSNEVEMAQWLVQNGPISVGINANAMQFYVGGVSHPFKFLCNPKNLDHGVLIVGYGTSEYPLFHKKLPYWIIKNSWGKRWGEQGYYRVYRGDGTCGVNTMATSAVVV